MPSKTTNFKLVTPQLDLDTKDFELDFTGDNMPANLKPSAGTTTNPAILDGEWMELTTAYKLTRAGVGAASPNPVWPVYTEKGRSDVMGINKLTVIWRGTYEVNDNIYMLSDRANQTVGTKLMVVEGAVVSGGSAKHSCLKEWAAGASATVVGVVTKAAGSDSDPVRIYCAPFGWID